MTTVGVNSKGFVCEYKKRSAWFSSFEIRYIVIEDERMKVFKNEKEYVNSKRRHSKPSMTVVLRNARLKIGREPRHPHILSIQVRGTHHFLSFVNDDQLRMCQQVLNRVIESANLIRPTIAQLQQNNDTINEHDINTRYKMILNGLGLPPFKVQELVEQQSFVSKMDIITQNQIDLKARSSKLNDIEHWIKVLRRSAVENVNITQITDIATALYEESNEWSIQFINEQGLSLLVRLIPHQIKTNNIKFEIELLQCFQAICDKMNGNDKIGLMYIVSDVTAIQGIIDLFESHDVQVSILIIKILSVICWHSPIGFEKVMDGLELYAHNTNNQSIWIPIIVMLKPMIKEIKSQFAKEYVLFTIGLINAILNSFSLLEDRVCYRKELQQLGFDKVISYLSDLIISMEDDVNDDIWMDKMEEHIDLYEAVKLKDMRDSSLNGIDVSNPQHLFQFLNQHCIEEGYLNEFLHILQCLTSIPRNAPYIWSTIEKIMSYSTAPIRKLQLNDILEYQTENKDEIQNDLDTLSQHPQHAFPSFLQLKSMLSRYDDTIHSIQSQSHQYTQQISLLQQQITNLKYKLSEQQLLNDEIMKQNKNTKPPSELNKYLKMIKMRVPLIAVQNKMKQNGDYHHIEALEYWMNQKETKTDETKTKTDETKTKTDETKRKTDEAKRKKEETKRKTAPIEIEKYLKMLSFSIPLKVVFNKMKQNGDGAHIPLLEEWLNPSAKPPQQIQKYLKMLSLKIPLKIVVNKMKQNGDGAHIPLLREWLNIESKEVSVANKLPDGMKAKPKIKPRQKMKTLHWTTIKPCSIKNTIWDGLDDSEINIDIKTFENLFKRKVIESKTKQNKAKAAKSDKNEKIHLIDAKRSYNVDIGLSRFKLNHQSICDAILLLDETELNLDAVIKLRNYIPDKNEQELLATFDGDVTVLPHTERFFLVLSSIDDLALRMELWQFKLQFNVLLQSQMDKIKILRTCHDNVKNSDSFKTVLQYILRFGNYMNGGTRKGQCFGFKLNSLKQVISAKSVDNKMSLLHYIHIQLEKNHPNAIKFTNDFDILSKGSRLDFTEITAKIKKIGINLNKIKNKLKATKSDSHSKCDLFSAKMTAFLSDSEPPFSTLKKEHDAVQSDCNKLAHYFDAKNDTKFTYFKDLYHFSQEFKKTGNNIKKQRELEAKQQRNAQIKALRQQRLKNRNGKHHIHRRTSSNRATQIYKNKRLSTTEIEIEKTDAPFRTSLTNSVVYDIKMSAIQKRRKMSSKPSSYKKSRWFA